MVDLDFALLYTEVKIFI